MFDHKEQRFSIRKYSCGAASVLIGCVLFMGGQTVSADEQATTGTVPEAAQVGTANKTQNTTESIDVSSQSAATQKETAVTTTAPASSSADTGVAKTSSENTQKTITADKAVSVATETTPSQTTTVDAATQTEDETTNSSVDATTDTATPSTTVKVEKSPVEKEAGKEEADVAKLMDKTQPAQQARLAESKVTQSVPSLPSQGYYTYTKRTEVKNEPKASAALQFYVNAGDRVFYDQVLIADGYQWLSYRSYSGVRRYAAINKLIQSEPQQPAKQTPSSTGTFPSRGRYIFSGTTEVKNEAKLSAPTQFTFNRGDSVNYDKVLENDGYQWISYISYSGMRRYAAVTKLAQPAPQRPAQSQVTGTIHIENKTSQGFDVVVTNVNSTKGVKTVKLPIWSSQGGQDDIIWYDATKQNDGTYKLSVDIRRHKNNYGDYNVHMYYVQSDGSLQGVTGTTTKVEEPKYSVTGTIHIENKTSQGFDVVVTDVSSTKGVKMVKLPVWSSQGGQDDIIWYDAAKQIDGTYKLSVDIRRHKNNRGEYNIHMYYVQSDGSLQGVTGTTTKVEEPKYSVTGTINIQNKTSQGFDVLITNASDSNGISRVKVPIWTDKGGQDDIIWYDATKQSDGNYKVSVNIDKHKGEYGEYNIHLYYIESNGKVRGVSGTKTTVVAPSSARESIPSQGVYTFKKEVEVKNSPTMTAKTEFTFAKGERIRYDKVLDADHHQWISYVSYSGTRRYIPIATLTNEEAPKPVQVTGTIHIENKTSQGFDVVVTDVSSTKGVKTVKLPVWSSQGGQDDVIWYDAVKQTDGSYKLSVDIRRHKNNRGEYNIHMYYVQSDGSLQGVTGTTTKVEDPQTGAKEVQYNGSYYFIQGKYDEIVVANKKHPMAANYNPGENPTAKAAFLRLRNDMIAQGYNVGYAYSGFRSYDYQKVLYQNYVNKDGQAAADRYSARPGYSEHQTGLVFDLTDKAGNLLEDAAASNWLKNNAHRYGFVVRYQPGKEVSTGYMPEAWHIRYIGKEADEVYHSGLSLEEYYGFEGGDYASSVTPSKPTTPSPQTPSIPAQGVYRFTKRSSIKAEARMSAPELAYYDAGQSVTYDKVLNADGATWISYIAFSGKRRYIAIS